MIDLVGDSVKRIKKWFERNGIELELTEEQWHNLARRALDLPERKAK